MLDIYIDSYVDSERSEGKNTENGFHSDGTCPSSPFGPKSRACLIKPKTFDPISLELDALENYYVWSDIGKGTFATVKFGTQKETGRKVAIKIYEKTKLKDPIRRKSVETEIKVLKKLDHQNVLSLQESIEGKKNIYLVLEHIQGNSLYSYIQKASWNKLDEPKCAQIFSQVVQGLDYCHSKGVCHRDIKLENIIIDPAGRVKIIDFGFATYSSSRYKKTYLYCGTPNYMAPEIVRREQYSGELADVWAVGVLLFMMLTGRFPFGSFRESQVFNRILKHDIVYPDLISFKCKQLLRSMLEPSVQKRATMKEVLTHPWVIRNGKSERKNMPLFGDHGDVSCD